MRDKRGNNLCRKRRARIGSKLEGHGTETRNREQKEQEGNKKGNEKRIERSEKEQ